MLLFAPRPALAQAEPFSPQSLSGYLDLRASDADGERSWLAGGFGKTRVSGNDPRLSIGEAALAWRPRLGWDWSAVVEGEIQPDHDHAVRLGEAFVKYKPFPVAGVRYSVRAGLFYPPISQEHEGPFWTPTETITPSAVNSWVGEEVKVVGVEASARKDIGEQSFTATAALFGFNDTAGTLLATRGWALDDVRTNASGRYRLPPLSDFLAYVQARATNPVREIDGRPGVYGRLDWRPEGRLALNVLYYDTLGNLVAVKKLQWAWDTRFINVGAVLDLDDNTRILSQVMVGDTRMGYGDPSLWVNTGFSAGYLMVTRKLGADSVSGRIDVFSTADRTESEYGDTREHGWALTADYRKRLSAHVSALLEVLHVDSNRPARHDILDEPARQRQTVAQAALRLSF
jgi:hypothetical protein